MKYKKVFKLTNFGAKYWSRFSYFPKPLTFDHKFLNFH